MYMNITYYTTLYCIGMTLLIIILCSWSPWNIKYAGGSELSCSLPSKNIAMHIIADMLYWCCAGILSLCSGAAFGNGCTPVVIFTSRRDTVVWFTRQLTISAVSCWQVKVANCNELEVAEDNTMFLGRIVNDAVPIIH